MKHLYSLAHLSAISLPPVDLIEVAARTGYEYVGLRLTRVTDTEPLYPIIASSTAMRATKAALAQTGVRVWDVELARMDPTHTPEMYLPLLEATAELGARHIIAQLPDPDRARAHDRFARLCELAAPLGITVNLEFPWWTETGKLVTATAVLEATQAPNAGLLIDMLHFYRSHSSLQALAALPRQWFNYAHLCDGPAAMPADLDATLFEARCHRLAPGEGQFDVKSILTAMPQDMTYVLEIPNDPVCAEIGFEGWARHILDAAKHHLDTEPSPQTKTPLETAA
ncbi:MAG: sugar phosphate isomerase/epimerase [Comamonadaceae bacterium]|nr:sugar phosphate isomerase/epimerase [Comamonadaceae bacterium]